MKRLTGLFAFSFLISSCGDINQINLTNPEQPTVIQNIPSNQEATKAPPVPLSYESSMKIAKLFDRNQNGNIEAHEFKANMSIWTLGRVTEQYENWDHLKRIPLDPIPVEAIARALSIEKGDGFFYFGTVKNDDDISEDDVEKISKGISEILTEDPISKGGRIPVGALKTSIWSGETKTVTEIISPSVLQRAIARQLYNSPDKQMELGNKLRYNNDGNEKVAHRINHIEYKHIGW